MARPHFLIHSLGGRHLGCLKVWDFLALYILQLLNIHVQVLCRHLFSHLLGIYLEVELLGHMVSLFNLLKNIYVYIDLREERRGRDRER